MDLTALLLLLRLSDSIRGRLTLSAGGLSGEAGARAAADETYEEGEERVLL